MKSVFRRPKINKRTRKQFSKNVYSKEEIVIMFLNMLNSIKLYHWKTKSYAEHKATDELYSNLNANIDKFVETLLGKTGNRVNLTNVKMIELLDCSNMFVFKQEIEKYKKYLINMSLNITSNSDLLNIRDELLGDLNKFTYLLTFNK
jgi:hypothetical protein